MWKYLANAEALWVGPLVASRDRKLGNGSSLGTGGAVAGKRVGNSESVLRVAGFEKCLQRARPSAELGIRLPLLRMICR